jgi:hypothetical protein
MRMPATPQAALTEPPRFVVMRAAVAASEATDVAWFASTLPI